MKKLKELFWKFYINTDKSRYDDKHIGTFSFWRLFILNLLKPGRLIKRFQYNQVFKNKNKILEKYKNKKKNNFSDEKNKKILKGLSDLFENGVAVIPEYFSSKQIDNFLNQNKQTIENLKNYKPDIPSYNSNDLSLSDELNSLWLDDGALTLLTSYIGNSVYARNYPEISYTYVPNTEFNKNSNFKRASDTWHVDHAVLFVIHILLDDVNENDTCMEVVPGTQRIFNLGVNWSKNAIKDLNKKNIKCIGKKGTIHIHSGNVIHRLNPIKGSQRLALHLEFSPGPNILLDSAKISKSLNGGYNLNNLTEEKREILKGIFPKKLFKGYDIKGDSIQPNKFKGI